MGKKIILSTLSLLLCLPGVGLANIGSQSSVVLTDTEEQSTENIMEVSEPNGQATIETEMPAPEPGENGPSDNWGPADDDFTPPVLDHVVITPETANVGDEITVKIKAHDDGSGINYIYAILSNPENQQSQYINFSYDQLTDEWIGNYIVGMRDMPGLWTLSEVNLYDNAYNYTNAPSDATVMFENPNGDFGAPVIHNLEVTPQTVQVGEKVTITSEITDDKSGVQQVKAYLSHPSGAYKYITMRYDAGSQKWVGSFEVTETTAPGDWTVQVSAFDYFYNDAYKEADGPLTVINPDGDYMGPEISNIEVTPSEVNAGEQIRISADVTDDKSDVSWVTAYSSFGELVFKHDESTGKWVADYTIPTRVRDGETVGIYSFVAYDSKGNRTEQWSDVTFVVHNETGDFTPPVLESAELSAQEVSPGDKVQIRARVTDSQSGVRKVSAGLGESYFPSDLELKYDEASGDWIGEYTVSNVAKPGELELRLTVEDQNGNYDFLYTGQFLKINNPNADLNAPVIKNVEVTPSTVNGGEELTITAELEDAESGIYYAGAYLNPVGKAEYEYQAYVPLTFDVAQNKWVGTYKITEKDPDGEWYVKVVAADYYYNSSFNNGTTLTVHNQDGDAEAPVVDSLRVSAAIAKPGDTVTFETKLVDNRTGVKSASIELGLNESNNLVTVPLTYNSAKDVWTGSYTIPAYSTSGPNLVYVSAVDGAGNKLRELSERTLVIANENPDKQGPIVEDIEFSPNEAAVGDTVEFKVHLKDEISGIRNAGIILAYTDGYIDGAYAGMQKEIELAYDAEQNVWIGKYTIQPTDLKGKWNVHVMAVDNAGNMNMGSSTTKLVMTPAIEDITAPEKPVVNEVTNKDTAVTGQAEAGSMVEVKVGDVVIGTVEAGSDGQFTVTIPVQAEGTELNITALDKAGNVSEAAAVTVKDVIAPEKPTVNEVTDKDTIVTGQAEAGSMVEVKAGDAVVGTAEAGSDGQYTVTIPVQAAGTELSITSTDKAGNVSEATSVSVKDVTAPEKPTVNIVTKKDTTVTGKAEAGSTVTVLVNGTVIGTAEAGTDGLFTVSIPLQKKDTELTIIATDKAGNVSEAVVIFVSKQGNQGNDASSLNSQGTVKEEEK